MAAAPLPVVLPVALPVAQQHNHPNAFTTDEVDDALVEDTLREKAALVVEQSVTYIGEAKKRYAAYRALVTPAAGAAGAAAAPAPPENPWPKFHSEVRAFFRCGDGEGSWKFGQNEIRYTLHLLVYYLYTTFQVGKEQTMDSMHQQAVRAVVDAIAAEGQGRLRAVVHLWDVDMTMVTWSKRALGSSLSQRQYCFAIVHRYLKISFKQDRWSRDVFNYECFSDCQGMALFDQSMHTFRNALLEVWSCVAQSLTLWQRKKAHGEVLDLRKLDGGGDGGGNAAEASALFTASAEYQLTAMLLGHAPDGRLYSKDEGRLAAFLARLKREGKVFKDASNFAIFAESLILVLKEVHRSVRTNYRTMCDSITAGKKSDVVGQLLTEHGQAFLTAVRSLAPSDLVSKHNNPTQDRKRQKSKSTVPAYDRLILHVCEHFLESYINLRFKVLRKNSTEQLHQAQTQSFRQTRKVEEQRFASSVLSKISDQVEEASKRARK